MDVDVNVGVGVLIGEAVNVALSVPVKCLVVVKIISGLLSEVARTEPGRLLA